MNNVTNSSVDQTKGSMNRVITLRRPDQTGHSDLALAVAEAIAKVIEEHYENSRAPYVNGEAFIFSARSNEDTIALLQDTIRLRQQLLESPDGQVMVSLMPLAVGGVS